MKKLILVIAFLLFSSTAHAFSFFPTEGVDIPISASNQLGLAVNQQTGHIFVTSLSLGGEDNLYEYESNGSLIRSTRVNLGNHITDLVVGSNDHLYVEASQQLFEISQDGSQIFSSLTLPGSTYDLAYDYNNDQILNTTQGPDNSFLSPTFGIVSRDLSGVVINSSTQQNVVGDRDPQGLAYNSNNDHLFAAFNSRIGGDLINFMVEYTWNSLELAYEELAFYDLESITPSGLNTLDFNNASNLFYLGNNEGVYGFGLDELTQFTVPEPTTHNCRPPRHWLSRTSKCRNKTQTEKEISL